MKNNDIIKIERINSKNEFVIRWMLTNLCNYQCKFCIQGDPIEHAKNAKLEKIEIREQICNNLLKFIDHNLKDSKYEVLRIYLIGGEVTILPDFIDILKKLLNCNFPKKVIINITTNASFNHDLIKKIKSTVINAKKNRNLCLSCSFYKAYTTEEVIIEKIKDLKKYNFIQKQRLKSKNNYLKTVIGYPILNDDDANNFLAFKNKYQSLCKNINYIFIRDKNVVLSDKTLKQLQNIETDQKKKFKISFKNGQTQEIKSLRYIGPYIQNQECFCPKGYKCDNGMNSLSIETNGDIYRCVYKNTFVGNILKDYNIKLPKKSFACKARTCACSYSVNKIEKIK